MKAIKLTAGILVMLGALWGIFDLINRDGTLNLLVGIALFTVSFLIGIMIIVKGWRSMYYHTLLLFLVQTISIKYGAVKYIFASIASLVVYLPLHKGGKNFFFYSLPYFSLVQGDYFEGFSVGVNLFAVLIFFVVCLIGKNAVMTAK